MESGEEICITKEGVKYKNNGEEFSLIPDEKLEFSNKIQKYCEGLDELIIREPTLPNLGVTSEEQMKNIIAYFSQRTRPQMEYYYCLGELLQIEYTKRREQLIEILGTKKTEKFIRISKRTFRLFSILGSQYITVARNITVTLLEKMTSGEFEELEAEIKRIHIRHQVQIQELIRPIEQELNVEEDLVLYEN